MAHRLLLLGVRSNKPNGGNKMKNLLNDNKIDNLLNRIEIADDNDRSWMTDVATSDPYHKPTEDNTPNWRMTLHG